MVSRTRSQQGCGGGSRRTPLDAQLTANHLPNAAAYHETDLSRPNAEFFIRHALHDHADFIFIVNGDAKLQFPTHLPNVKVINRSNTCYDLGAHGQSYRDVSHQSDAWNQC